MAVADFRPGRQASEVEARDRTILSLLIAVLLACYPKNAGVRCGSTVARFHLTVMVTAVAEGDEE
jgi:hypothetical protein